MDVEKELGELYDEPEQNLVAPGPKTIQKVGQEHIYNLLTGNDVSWQAIIYDLINTEQLDPWDLDLGLLANKYLEKIRLLEEANFFISSKVLYAASLLLRIKAEFLLDKYIKSLDEILYGKKELKKYKYERIEIDENEIPLLVPKTPLPRFRKVTLNELISALDKAINTESRRIRNEISDKQREKITQIVFPRTKINMRDRINQVFSRVRGIFSENKKTRIGFTELAGTEKDNRIATFLPLLHLDTQMKLGLEHEKHFEEIWILLFHEFKRQQALRMTQEQIDEKAHELREEYGWENPEEHDEFSGKRMRKVEKANKAFENPLANFFGDIK